MYKIKRENKSMKITLELLGAIVVGIIGVAQGLVVIMQFIGEKKKDRVKTEQLLFNLQQELTTGETWEMLNKQPVDNKYLILTYERVIIKFMLLKKIANENSPAISSIVRNIHYIESIISSEYTNSNNLNVWTKIYRDSRQNLISKIERINRKNLIVSDFYSKEYTEIAIVQTIMGERLLKMLDFSDIQSVLDFGCGDGRDAITMATKFPTIHVDGFDASSELINLANKKKHKLRISNVNFRVKDVNNFNKEDEYNIIFCNYLIHWVGPQCFKIAYKALKNGGQFVASVSGSISGEGATPELREVVCRKIKEIGYDKYFQQWNDTRYNPSQDTVEKELQEAGFTGIKVVTEKYNNLDLEIGKTSKEIYEAELVTTLPPYYAKLRNDEERRELFDSVLSCLIEEATPINNVDIVIQAKK
jgi:ubiquinone/menaquinone biosynthesis C-methylase UbiE